MSASVPRSAATDSADGSATPLRRPAQRQLGQIDNRHRRAPVVEYAGYSIRCLGDRLDAYERQDFLDLTGVKRITIVTELKDNEEHRAVPRC